MVSGGPEEKTPDTGVSDSSYCDVSSLSPPEWHWPFFTEAWALVSPSPVPTGARLLTSSRRAAAVCDCACRCAHQCARAGPPASRRFRYEAAAADAPRRPSRPVPSPAAPLAAFLPPPAASAASGCAGPRAALEPLLQPSRRERNAERAACAGPPPRRPATMSCGAGVAESR